MSQTTRSTAATFGALKQVDAGVLNVGYAEAGPADGPPVILLHGWPYDIHSFVDVAPTAGGGGLPGDRAVPARLRRDALPVRATRSRNGQQSALAVDIVAFMDALKIEKAVSPASTGARERPTSSPRSGRSAARRWSR